MWLPFIRPARRVPWNKGKVVGQKAPLKLKDICSIRIRLELGERRRELAWHSDLAHVLGLEIRVALEFVPRVVKGELCHLVNLVAALEQAAGGLMPEVMEVQILDAQDTACTGKSGTDALGVVGEDVFACARLPFYDRPGLGGVLEPPVIAFLVPRMLRIPHDPGPTDFVVVDPFKTRDLRLSPRRGDGEVHDRQHGNLRASVTRGEVVAQPRALARLADETQRCARVARLLRYLRAHRELLDVARGSQHDANPDQIIHDRRRACAIRSTTAHVANQRGGGELQGIHFTDRVVLEELEMTLLASLPSGDRLEGFDVPADEGREADGPVLLAAGYGLVFELYFAVHECLGFPMDDHLVQALPYDRGVADRTIGLPACLDRCHDGIWRRQADLVSFMSPPQTLNYPECPKIPQKRQNRKCL